MTKNEKTAVIITNALNEIAITCQDDPVARTRSFVQLVSGTLGYVALSTGLNHVKPHEGDEAVQEIMGVILDWVVKKKSELN